MIVIRGHRILDVWNVSVGEVEELLRLRDSSVLHVTPRTIDEIRKRSIAMEEMDVDDGQAVIQAESPASKGIMIPQEVWSYMSDVADKRKIFRLTAVCRWWALHWRQYIFANVELESQADVYKFAALLRFSSPHLPPVRHYVKELVVRHEQNEPPIGSSRKSLTPPWLHTFYMYLQKPLLADNSKLTVKLYLDGTGRWDRIRKNTRTVHDFLPRPLPTLHPRCHHLELMSMHFALNRDVVDLIRSLGVSQSVEISSVNWDAEIAYRVIPTTIRTLAITGTQCPGLFPLIASRSIGGAVYELSARDLTVVHNILRDMQLWCSFTTFIVDESTGKDGHVCVKYWLQEGDSFDSVLLECTANTYDETVRAGKYITPKKYLLGLRRVVFLLKQPLNIRSPGDGLPLWPKIVTSVGQLPMLERVIVGHRDKEAMVQFQERQMDALHPLVRAGKLSQAYLTGGPVPNGGYWSEKKGEVWIEVHARTMEPTGNTCPYVHAETDAMVFGFRYYFIGRAPMRGLDALLPGCDRCITESEAVVR